MASGGVNQNNGTRPRTDSDLGSADAVGAVNEVNDPYPISDRARRSRRENIGKGFTSAPPTLRGR